MTTDSVERLKQHKPELLAKYSQSSNIRGSIQFFNTLLPYLAIWYLAIASLQISYWLTALCVLFLILFLLRMFVLMHEAGHNSLFCNYRLNQFGGFILGVFCGMPQYVWSQHHNYHHATNGDWSKYRGPLNTFSTEEFSQLSVKKQKSYVRARKLINAPIAGFFYLIFSPRYNWIKGSLLLLSYVLRKKWQQPAKPINTIAAEFETRYWSSAKEYWHMTANNLVLISLWIAMSLLIGPLAFFTIYIISLSLSGAGGIILFTVQHNFEHAYASDENDWDYHQAALQGTSYLKLPRILNWFTANIGYHHIHHLSARIPNYLLKECHKEYHHLFSEVPRITLLQVRHALSCVLWDTKARRIISVNEFYASEGARS